MTVSRRNFVKACAAGAALTGLAAGQEGRALAAPAGAPGLTAYEQAPGARTRPVEAPPGAPNIVIILIDDMGFGAPGAFGGPCHMPTLEWVAAEGLRYNRFHTTAMCSPTRQAMLTGRNHHSVNMGCITNLATDVDGYTSSRPDSAATIAELLRLNGYGTAAFGKMHQTPEWEVNPAGPYDRWPVAEGFEKFYGFLGAETNQWAPGLYDGTTPVEPPDDPDYHLTPDLVNHAIEWVRSQHSMAPHKPFFAYLSFGATHAPHHVPPEWIAKYKGQFDMGWDAARENTLANQKALGLVPPNTELTPRPVGIKAWDELAEDQQRAAAALMEVYAAFAEHTDYHAGLFLDELQSLGVLDNTLVFYIAGDNGASAEGTMIGTSNQMAPTNGVGDTAANILARIDQLGSIEAYNHYPIGWAHAMNCPFQWTKQVASHWGGTRSGMAVRWPAGFGARGEVRAQFHHVIDIAPTILECAGIREPQKVNGIMQMPIEGVSMRYSFDDGSAPDRHITQYFELLGNRGIYHDGWSAVVLHKAPWRDPVSWDDEVWELYDGATDWSQAHDVASLYPGKLTALKKQFDREARQHNVYPLDDRLIERFDPDVAGRPSVMSGRTSLTLYPGMVRLTENTVPNVKNRSHTITADIEAPGGAAANGVIVAHGGQFAGWSLYVKDGVLKYCHNFLGLQWFYVTAAPELSPGRHTVAYRFDIDPEPANQPGKGGWGTLFVDGMEVGRNRIPVTVPVQFSLDETLDVGCDLALPVTSEYPMTHNAFTGKIHSVTIDIGQDATVCVDPPENIWEVVMANQ